MKVYQVYQTEPVVTIEDRRRRVADGEEEFTDEEFAAAPIIWFQTYLTVEEALQAAHDRHGMFVFLDEASMSDPTDGSMRLWNPVWCLPAPRNERGPPRGRALPTDDGWSSNLGFER
jgi:hypothetical protein